MPRLPPQGRSPRTGPAGRKGGASARGPHPPGGQSVQGGVWSAAGEGDGQAGQRPRLWVRSPAASLGSSGAAPQGQEEKQPAAAVPPEGPAVPAPGRAGRARRASPPPGVREEGRRAGRASLAAQPARPSRDRPSSSFALRLLQGGSDRAFSPVPSPAAGSFLSPRPPSPRRGGAGVLLWSPAFLCPRPTGWLCTPSSVSIFPTCPLPLEAPGSGPV